LPRTTRLRFRPARIRSRGRFASLAPLLPRRFARAVFRTTSFRDGLCASGSTGRTCSSRGVRSSSSCSSSCCNCGAYTRYTPAK